MAGWRRDTLVTGLPYGANNNTMMNTKICRQYDEDDDERTQLVLLMTPTM